MSKTLTVRRENRNPKNGWIRNDTTSQFCHGIVCHQTQSGNLTLEYVLDEPGKYTLYENWYGKITRETFIV